MSEIVVVVPTCRAAALQGFLQAWREQFLQHGVLLLVVRDDEAAGGIYEQDWAAGSALVRVSEHELLMGRDRDIIARKSPACRNLGFAYVAKFVPDAKYIITLDDDVVPQGDTIGDHVRALQMRVPTSWMSSTTGGPYMRGFPYGVRHESPVWVSHGVWYNIPDLDAPTQLVLGDSPAVEFYRGPVPKDIYFPVCGMNLAFRREALPFMYWCPTAWLPGAQRFDDIWMGLHVCRSLSHCGAALVSGYAECVHTRLSNTFKNLEQEVRGICLNETYWNGDEFKPRDAEEAAFFERYTECRHRWFKFIETTKG